MRNSNSKLFFCLFLLMLNFICCSDKKNIKIYYSNENKNSYYRIEKKNDTIISIFNHRTKQKIHIDTTIYTKKINGYYDNYEDPFYGSSRKLGLSTIKDTLYNYKVALANFYCKISKIDNQHFKTVYANYDSLVYKFRNSIYYDKNYNIYKIENIINKEKYVYIPR